MSKTLLTGILVTVIGGFILALLIGECRERKQDHAAILKLQNEQKK